MIVKILDRKPPEYSNCYVITIDLYDGDAWEAPIAFPKIICKNVESVILWYEALKKQKGNYWHIYEMPEPFIEIGLDQFTIPGITDGSFFELYANDVDPRCNGVLEIVWHDELGLEYFVEIEY